MIYLDNAASTAIDPLVLDVMVDALKKHFANPSAAHRLGKIQRKLIDEARSKFLKRLNAPDGQLVFTSSATEANSTLLLGLDLKSGDEVLYNKADHPSVVQAVESLSDKGIQVISVGNRDDGLWNINELSEKLNAKTRLVCLCHVNNQTGSLQHVERISKLLKAFPDCHFHLDGMQALGKVEVDLSRIGADSYSVGAHKIYGPKGIGALYLKEGVKISPLLLGGNQQNGLRSSTENTPLVLAFEKAFELIEAKREKIYAHCLKLNEMIREMLEEHAEISITYKNNETVPHILMMKVEGISSDIILRHMEEEEIYLSSGSACSSKIKGFNPVLHALGLPEKSHKFYLRVSLGQHNTEAEVEKFCSYLIETIDELKGFLP
ncbi:MAG: cysteine desulfurase [Deltaproteobacteria bacterium]|nr:MAG: cysteine desulfurase [Deltaproteobacteria bacterium]